MLKLVMDPVIGLAGLLLFTILLEVIFRLIPTKKPLNILALVARGLAKLAMLLRAIGDLLPERRK